MIFAKLITLPYRFVVSREKHDSIIRGIYQVYCAKFANSARSFIAASNHIHSGAPKTNIPLLQPPAPLRAVQFSKSVTSPSPLATSCNVHSVDVSALARAERFALKRHLRTILPQTSTRNLQPRTTIIAAPYHRIPVRNCTALSSMPGRKPFERLPTNVKPTHYKLCLAPDLETLTFQGDVYITLMVLEATDTFVVNALDLVLNKIVISGNGRTLSPKSIQLSVEDETIRIEMEHAIVPGEWVMQIQFKGEINDKMKGLYRSKYLGENGDTRYAAVTQFEATDARRCFPCYDEPALKATFDISLLVPPNLVALSNMPVKIAESRGDLIQYDFEVTPVMSTYLVAIVVGEYDYVEDTSDDGVLVRVYTPKGKKEQGLFALEVATKVLPYYKDYFNIAYPLPKIDLIAIADFSAGAMENWGLVTYRETCLLFDPQNTSAVRKQWIALVVGHELAHQWFGNLVTMEWWTHLWLNEGYATFVEFLCVNHLFPEYDIWTQFVTDIYSRALELDGLDNSHPIEVPVGHPSEIDEIFDDISYNKGASVIRMLHNYIGDADFRKGMNQYLTRHQYKNTFTEDLWAALGKASNKPVGDVMSTWTKQLGFPVVKVTPKYATDNSGCTLTLEQRKYCANGGQAKGDFLWMIPFSVSTSKNPKNTAANTVLKSKSGTLFVPDVGPDDWIKVNPGAVGFYRTEYTSDMVTKLVPAIRNRTLPPLDRLGLLDDLYAMVLTGVVPTVQVLKLMTAFADEDNYTVWCSISNITSKLGILLSGTACEDGFKTYEKHLLANISQRLGWNPSPNESHLDTLLRSLVLGRMAWLDDEQTTIEAEARFANYISGQTTIPADIRNACYRAVMRSGSKDTYDAMIKLYKSADLHEEKDRIGRSLGATKHPDLLERVLNFAVSEHVRAQDTVAVITSVALTGVGRSIAWEYLKKNWNMLMDRYQGSFLLARLVKHCTENFTSAAMAQEVDKFFEDHKSLGTERTIQQSLESIRLNASWLERDRDEISNYLSSCC